MIRKVYIYVKVESGRVFVVLGAHVRVLTPINNHHFKTYFCMNIKDVFLGKSVFFLCSCKKVLCVHINHSITYRHFQNFKKFFTYVWLEIWDNLHAPNAGWLAFCDMHICA